MFLLHLYLLFNLIPHWPLGGIEKQKAKINQPR
jgi:hypothetical protein